MRIAIPVGEKKEKADIYETFGRAPYFLIYETDSKDIVFIDNENNQGQGGVGIKTAQLMLDNNIDSVIVPRCGENATNVLKSGKVKIFKMVGTSVGENLQAFQEGKLSEL